VSVSLEKVAGQDMGIRVMLSKAIPTSRKIEDWNGKCIKELYVQP
jgi:hypothetical protein